MSMMKDKTADINRATKEAAEYAKRKTLREPTSPEVLEQVEDMLSVMDKRLIARGLNDLFYKLRDEFVNSKELGYSERRAEHVNKELERVEELLIYFKV